MESIEKLQNRFVELIKEDYISDKKALEAKGNNAIPYYVSRIEFCKTIKSYFEEILKLHNEVFIGAKTFEEDFSDFQKTDEYYDIKSIFYAISENKLGYKNDSIDTKARLFPIKELKKIAKKMMKNPAYDKLPNFTKAKFEEFFSEIKKSDKLGVYLSGKKKISECNRLLEKYNEVFYGDITDKYITGGVDTFHRIYELKNKYNSSVDHHYDMTFYYPSVLSDKKTFLAPGINISDCNDSLKRVGEEILERIEGADSSLKSAERDAENNRKKERQPEPGNKGDDFLAALRKKEIFDTLAEIVALNPNFKIKNLKEMFPDDRDSYVWASQYYDEVKKSLNKPEEIMAIESLVEFGIPLSTEQEDMLIGFYNPKFKVEKAKEKNQQISEERLNWQNDPSHPDNVRVKELEETKNLIERLDKLKVEGNITPEQLDELEQAIDFVKLSRNVNDRVIEPMPFEIRKELHDYYSSLSADGDSSKIQLPISEIRKKLKDISEKREIAKLEEQRVNEEKINWQNSPDHPDNVRTKELEEAKNMIIVLNKLKELNIISKEQIEMLEQSSDFVKLSRNVEDRVIEPMPSEIREELKAYYTEQEEQGRSK